MLNNELIAQLGNLLISPYLWAMIIAYLGGQIGKVVIQRLRGQQVGWRDLFASGNMPSTHAASAFALTMVIGYYNRFDSALFVLALMMSLVISYDACHVRRAVGEQGMVLKQLINNENKTELLSELNNELLSRHELKARVAARNNDLVTPYYSRGHLVREVVVGIFIGIIIGLTVAVIWNGVGIK